MSPRLRTRAALRTAALALALPLGALSCARTPPEPAPPAPPASPASLHRPALEQSARRVLAALAGGGSVAPSDRALRLALPVPASIDAVAVHTPDRWVVAAVERDRVTVGLAGAERAYELARTSGAEPSAADLARVVGAFLYYPWRVWDGASWSDTPATPPQEPGTLAPMLTPLSNARGRTLTFAYAIPDGAPGAGPHLARLHVTASGYLVDEAPNPSRR